MRHAAFQCKWIELGLQSVENKLPEEGLRNITFSWRPDITLSIGEVYILISSCSLNCKHETHNCGDWKTHKVWADEKPTSLCKKRICGTSKECDYGAFQVAVKMYLGWKLPYERDENKCVHMARRKLRFLEMQCMNLELFPAGNLLNQWQDDQNMLHRFHCKASEMI